MKRDQPWLCASLHGRPESGDELLDRRFLGFDSSSPPAVVTDTKNDLQKAQICRGPVFLKLISWVCYTMLTAQCSVSAPLVPREDNATEATYSFWKRCKNCSTSLCYISLFSGCSNIAYSDNPLYVGGGRLLRPLLWPGLMFTAQIFAREKS